MGKQSNAWPIYWKYGETAYYEEEEHAEKILKCKDLVIGI